MTELEEALSAVNAPAENKSVLDSIVPAENKVPDGATIIGITLNRDPQFSGKFMSSITRGWNPSGMVIALKNGGAVGANYIMGHWRDGLPTVVPCHLLVCPHCGTRVLSKRAIWDAKDRARAAGADGIDKLGGHILLDRYGRCRCGSKWRKDPKLEAQELNNFASEVLKSIERTPKILEFREPRGFTVHAKAEAVELGQKWQFLVDAMAARGQSAVPIEKNRNGDAMIFNPGQWLGWTYDHMATGLFFENDAAAEHMGHNRGFNPANIDGL